MGIWGIAELIWPLPRTDGLRPPDRGNGHSLPMKTFLLLVLLPVALPGFGQGRDTVFAVHKLFRQKRGGADATTAAGLSAASGSTVGATRYVPQPADVASALVAGAVPTALGLVGQFRYSAQREAEVLKLYAEGWGLPPDIRRKLRRKYFRRTAADVRSGL